MKVKKLIGFFFVLTYALKFITDGMFVARGHGNYTKIPVFNKSEVFDVTGAGDTVTAVYTLALAAGADPVYAAIIGNIAASLVVKQFGCATTSIDEILNAVEEL